MNTINTDETKNQPPPVLDFYKEYNNNVPSPSSEMGNTEDESVFETEVSDDNVQELTTSVISLKKLEPKAIARKAPRKRTPTYEFNPSMRHIHKKRLLSQLRETVDELAVRVGQQVVVIIAPENVFPEFKIFGSQPLQDILRNMQLTLLDEFKRVMDLPVINDTSLFELPPIMVDGNPTTIDRMNQAQLRTFVPYMMKFSTGRCKPGWGIDYRRPPWWPEDIPYENVRTDVRPKAEKIRKPWTDVLRQLVAECYRYHEREDLLQPYKHKKTKLVQKPSENSISNNSETNNGYVIHLQPIAEATVTEDSQLFLIDKDGHEFPVSVSRMYSLPVYEMKKELTVPSENSSPENATNVEEGADGTRQVLIEGYGNDLPQVLEIIPLSD